MALECLVLDADIDTGGRKLTDISMASLLCEYKKVFPLAYTDQQ